MIRFVGEDTLNMSWQEEYIARYEERLREKWGVDGRRVLRLTGGTSLTSLIDQYGVVGGRDGEIYLGEDACQEAGLPTVIKMTRHEVEWNKDDDMDNGW